MQLEVQFRNFHAGGQIYGWGIYNYDWSVFKQNSCRV